MNKVLVVDDEFSVRELLSTSIKQFVEREVDLAQDGFEAVKKVMVTEYDLIICDIKMPKMNGIDAIKAIKIIKKDVPIVVITGYASDDEKAEAIKFGAAEVITKPFSIKKIVERIKFYLQEYKPADIDELNISSHSSQSTDNRIIVIGSSVDGPSDLKYLFKNLKKDNYPPILVVQHMPPGFIGPLCSGLTEDTGKSITEAEENDKLTPNKIYFASSPDHILIENGKIKLGMPAADQNFVPSISKTILDVSSQYGDKCLVLIFRGLSAHIDSQEGITGAVKNNSPVYALEDKCKILDKFSREGLLKGIVSLDSIVEIVDNF